MTSPAGADEAPECAPADPVPALPAWAAGGRWILVPMGIALASRAFSLALLAWFGRHGTRGRLPLWEIWDGQWYAGIAADGYHGMHIRGGYDFAFFPAWPTVVKAASSVGVPMPVVAFGGASLLFLVGATLVWRAIEQRMGGWAATFAVAMLAFAPPAFVFSLAYAESLFLVAVGAYFAAAAGSRWRPFAAALAVFTRLAGFAVVAAALVDVVRRRGPARRTAVVSIAGALVAFAVWWVFVAVITGDPLGYTRGTAAWFHDAPLSVLRGTVTRYPLRVAAWLAFGALIVAGVALVVRRQPDWAAFGAVLVGAALLPAIGGGFLHSFPRYLLVAFPAYAGLADRLGPRWSMAFVVVFALGQVAFASWVVPAYRTQAP